MTELFLKITNRREPEECMEIEAGNDFYNIRIRRLKQNQDIVTDSDTGRYIYEPSDVSIEIKPKGIKVLPLVVTLEYPNWDIHECYAYELRPDVVRNEETTELIKYIRIASDTLDNLKQLIDRCSIIIRKLWENG